MDFIPNFMNPILALALVMPLLTNNKLVQYLLPIVVYCALEGVYASQVGLYVTLFVATYCANHFAMTTSVIVTALCFHVVNLYAVFMHPDSTYLGALVADINLMMGTVVYLGFFMWAHYFGGGLKLENS